MSHPPGSSFFNYERSVSHMAKRDRNCYLCGTNYKYCPTCSQDRMKPTYMAEFHDENCKNIFDICTRYNVGMLTKEEAQEELMLCDLSNEANFKSYVQRDLANIFAEDEEQSKRGKRSELPIFDEAFDFDTHEVVITEEI